MEQDNPQRPSASELRAYAYRMLGRREYSVVELGERLRRKFSDAEEGAVDELLDALVQENLLSDQRYAESYVRSQVQRQQGPRKIQANLRARGVEDALIGAELGRYDEQWTDLAAAWLERRHPGELDFDDRGRYYRRLLNRGFSHDQAMDALDRHARP